ncbi:hypothetical protein D3C87_1821550 [compost metagenome]
MISNAMLAAITESTGLCRSGWKIVLSRASPKMNEPATTIANATHHEAPACTRAQLM